MIDTTSISHIEKFLKKNKEYFMNKSSMKFVIAPEDNIFDVAIIIETNSKKNYPTEKTFDVVVYQADKNSKESFLSCVYTEQIIIKTKVSFREQNAKFLPKVPKNKIVAAKCGEEVLYIQDGKYRTTYVTDYDIEADGYDINENTIICKEYKEFKKYLIAAPNDIEAFVPVIQEMLSDYDMLELSKDKEKILKILNEDSMRSILIAECPISVTDTFPREIILDRFEREVEDRF